jgi:hypothetical protein
MVARLGNAMLSRGMAFAHETRSNLRPPAMDRGDKRLLGHRLKWLSHPPASRGPGGALPACGQLPESIYEQSEFRLGSGVKEAQNRGGSHG